MASLEQALRFVLIQGSLLVLLYFAVTFLVVLFQQNRTGQRVMGRLAGEPPVRGSAWAAFAGAVTPFCSCSTVPVLVGLLQARVAFAASMTFLVSSPVINEGILLLFVLRGDWLGAFVFLVLATVLSIGMGLSAAWLGLGRYVTIGPSSADASGLSGASLVNPQNTTPWKIRLGFCVAAAVGELRRAFPWLALGIVAGGLLYGVVPDAWIDDLNQRLPATVLIPVLAALAVPFYLSPAMVVPVGLALVAKGLPVGAVVALVVAGVGTSAPELIMLGRVFRWPLIAAYVVGMILIATLIGLGLQYLLPGALHV